MGDLQLAGPDMLIDGYEQFNQETEVVNISPDNHSEEAAEPPLRADDCEPSVECNTAITLLTSMQSKR